MIATMMTPGEMASHIAQLAQARRLSLNLSQQTLAERSGVSYGTLKKFEQTGKISLESLLKLAWVLGCLDDFQSLLAPASPEQFKSLDALLKARKTRQRGRQ